MNGRTLWENVREAPNFSDDVIRTLDNPLIADGGICVVRGNLAPSGAVLKPSAATESLLCHRGQAVVFDTLEDYKQRVVDPDLEIDANSVMVLRNCGPEGYPGMAEVGNMEPTAKAAAPAGVTDMVRISDARMSGTAYGTRGAARGARRARAGGPLALVHDGDGIELDDAGRLHLDISDVELVAWLQAYVAGTAGPGARAVTRLFMPITSCRPTKAATSLEAAPIRAPAPDGQGFWRPCWSGSVSMESTTT